MGIFYWGANCNIGTTCPHSSVTSSPPFGNICHYDQSGPRVVVSTAAFHARVRGSVPGGLKEAKMFLPHPRVKLGEPP